MHHREKPHSEIVPMLDFELEKTAAVSSAAAE